MKDNILDADEFSSKSEATLREIDLLRGAENKYENRLLSARAALLLVSILFLMSMMTFRTGSIQFFYNLIFGVIFFASAYFAKFQPRIILIIGLLIYTTLMTYTYIAFAQPPHGAIIAFAFIMMVGQGLSVAQQLTIVRERLEKHREVPRYKRVWY